MKKVIAILLIFCLCFAFAACGNSEDNAANDADNLMDDTVDTAEDVVDDTVDAGKDAVDDIGEGVEDMTDQKTDDTNKTENDNNAE